MVSQQSSLLGLAYDDVFSDAIVSAFDSVFAFRASNRNLRRAARRQLHAPQGSRATPPLRSRRLIFSSGIPIVRRCSSISETHSRGKIIALSELRVFHALNCVARERVRSINNIVA